MRLVRFLNRARTRFVQRHFRRALAVVLLLGLVVGRLEAMFPDVHDGDADVSTQLVVGDLAAGLLSTDGNGSLPQPHQDVPNHSTHMEHCGHSHILVLGLAPRFALPPAAPSSVLDAPTSSPAAVFLPPHERPPIA